MIVVGEMTGVQTGLGAIIMEARQLSRTEIVIAGMVVIGIAGLLSDLGRLARPTSDSLTCIAPPKARLSDCIAYSDQLPDTCSAAHYTLRKMCRAAQRSLGCGYPCCHLMNGANSTTPRASTLRRDSNSSPTFVHL